MGDGRVTRRDLPGERLHGDSRSRHRRTAGRRRPIRSRSLGATPAAGRVDSPGALVHPATGRNRPSLRLLRRRASWRATRSTTDPQLQRRRF